MSEQLETAREVIRGFRLGDEWEATVEGELAPALAELVPELLDAYRRGDIEWLLEHSHAN